MSKINGEKKGIPILVQMLCICLATVVIVSVAIPFYLLPLFERQLLSSKKDEIRTLVEAAHSIVSAYHHRSAAGELKEVEAKQRALERVASMRYGKSGYFWINDMTPVMLMHPIDRELTGKSLTGYKDASGERIFMEFVKICQAQGEGFLPYQWPEPGSSSPVRKLSFVKSFQPWGWVIGTGVYATEVQQSITLLKFHLLSGTAVIVFLLVLATVVLAHRITLPLRHLAHFSRNLGELATTAPVEGCRETRELAIALNDTVERLSQSMVSRDSLDAALGFTRAIVDAIPMDILIVDAAHKTITDANEFMIRRMERSREEIKGERCHCIHWGCLEDTDGCPIEECRATGAMVIEEIRREVSGTMKVVLVIVAPVTIASGVVTQVVHVTQDITAIKETENALAEKNQELAQALESLRSMQSCVIQSEKLASIGQIAAGVAHEINNPVGFVKSNISAIDRYLAKLIGYIELLEQSHPSQEEVKRHRRELKIDYVVEDIPELIAESQGGIERVETIVRNLKSFSRLDSAQMTEVDLNACLDTTITIVWNEIKYNAELVKDYGELPLVSCFPQQMNQVFMNLLVNAAHAIETSGTIRITTWSDQKQVHVMVADTGCGMPPQICNRIFEPFFTTKPAGKGTGLGLSISYDIVKRHGGEMKVRSEDGNGSQFIVSIPISPVEPREHAPESLAS